MLTIGDAREWARGLVPGSVQTIVTSPPYFGLRDYGTATWEGGDPACNHIQKHARDDESRIRKVDATSGRRARATEYENSSANPIHYRGTCGKCGALRVDQQMGLEATPDEFVANLVALFRDLRAALRDDGTLWLNLGDSYAGSSMTGGVGKGTIAGTQHGARKGADIRFNGNASVPEGMKPKDLIGIPWLTAFALRADGWYLRSAITWCKRASMPESVTDRPTSATEMVFLLSKQPRYYYDADAIREPAQQRIVTDTPMRRVPEVNNNRHGGGNDGLGANPAGRFSPRPLRGVPQRDTAPGHPRRHVGEGRVRGVWQPLAAGGGADADGDSAERAWRGDGRARQDRRQRHDARTAHQHDGRLGAVVSLRHRRDAPLRGL
jgi:hypothetical protein